MDGAGWFELVALGVGQVEGDDAVVVVDAGGIVGDVAAGGDLVFVALELVGEGGPVVTPCDLLLFDGYDEALDQLGFVEVGEADGFDAGDDVAEVGSQAGLTSGGPSFDERTAFIQTAEPAWNFRCTLNSE